MLKNTGTRLGFGFGMLAILMAVSLAGNSAPTSGHQAIQGAAASQVMDYFPSGYVNRGRDGDGNVMTYEHD